MRFVEQVNKPTKNKEEQTFHHYKTSMGLAFIILIGFFIIITGVVLLVSGLYLPVFGEYLKGSDPSFREINYGFTEKIVRAGDIVELRFSPVYRSIGGHYRLYDVEFIPANQSLGIWKCNGSESEGRFDSGASWVSFDVTVNIYIPENPSLEGKTVDGTLNMTLRWANQETSLHYSWRTERLSKPLSIQIFNDADIEEFNALTDRLNSACFQTLIHFFLGGAGLIVLGFIGFFLLDWIENKAGVRMNRTIIYMISMKKEGF